MAQLSVENTAMVSLGAGAAAILAAQQWSLADVWSNLESGVLLALLALVQLLFGLRRTNEDPRNRLFVSFHLCLCASLLGVGGIAISSNINVPNSSLALLPTLAFSVFVSVAFMIFGMAAKAFDLALISFLWAASWSLAVVSLYTPASYQVSTAAVNTVLSLVALFVAVRSAFTKVKFASKEYKPKGKQPQSQKSAAHLLLFVYCCQLLAVFPALFLSTSDLISYEAFALTFIASGVMTLVGWVAILRYIAPFHSVFFMLNGSLWICSGLSLISGVSDPVNVASLSVMAVCFVFASILSAKESLFHIIQSSVYTILTIALAIQGYQSMFFLVMCWILMLITIYGVLHYALLISLKTSKVPLGKYDGISKEIVSGVNRLKTCCSKNNNNAADKIQSTTLESDILGFSKYSEIEMVGFLTNAIAAVSVLWLSPEGQVSSMFWTLPVGGVIQFIVGCVCLSRGKSLQSCSFIMYSMFWLLWGRPIMASSSGSFQLAAGPTAFLLGGLLLAALSLVIQKVWFFYSVALLVNPVLVICVSSGASTPQGASIALTVILSVVCFYAFFGSATKSVLGSALVPLGKAIIKVVYGANESGKVVMAPSKKAKGVSEIAAILNSGGIVGIPTDTVYVLVAACKFPKAVERAYNTKKQAGDRPMSLWISSLDQLEHARQEFGPLLWRFLNKVWPSSISLVVPKGPWLEKLGLGESEKYIGKPDSIAVRLPDYTVTTHLIDQVGPIAVTSANPSGEADTTHHSQVLARLEEQNCDGVLCDGASAENAASTVVDCRRLPTGGDIGFFRIGIMPKSKVLEHFEQAKQEEGIVTTQGKKTLEPLTIVPEAVRRQLSQLSPDIIVGHDGAPLANVKVIGDVRDAEQGYNNPAFDDIDLDDINTEMFSLPEISEHLSR